MKQTVRSDFQVIAVGSTGTFFGKYEDGTIEEAIKFKQEIGEEVRFPGIQVFTKLWRGAFKVVVKNKVWVKQHRYSP